MLAARRVFLCASPLSFIRPEYTSRSISWASSNRLLLAYVHARLPCTTSMLSSDAPRRRSIDNWASSMDNASTQWFATASRSRAPPLPYLEAGLSPGGPHMSSSTPTRARTPRRRDNVARTDCTCATGQTSDSSPFSQSFPPRPPRTKSSPAAPSTTRARRPVLEMRRRHDLHTRIHARGLLLCAGGRPRDRGSISGPSCRPRTPRPRPRRPPRIYLSA